jgi:hypothetical protein
MTAKGFSADMRHAPVFVGFRRMTPQTIHVCDIQWEKVVHASPSISANAVRQARSATASRSADGLLKSRTQPSY